MDNQETTRRRKPSNNPTGSTLEGTPFKLEPVMEEDEAVTKYSAKPFGEALAALLPKHQGGFLRVSLRAFAQEIGVNYSTLRSSVMGRTDPKPELIEQIAQRLGVDPSYFREYRVHKIVEAMEMNPNLAGKIFEYVLSLDKEREEDEENG